VVIIFCEKLRKYSLGFELVDHTARPDHTYHAKDIFERFLQTLDTDRGEFICPVCRQMANALLPVPPDAQDLPPAIVQNSLEKKANTIQYLLGEETFHMVR
jgi:hypothetical protein